jgi:hypothetical protein
MCISIRSNVQRLIAADRISAELHELLFARELQAG